MTRSSEKLRGGGSRRKQMNPVKKAAVKALTPQYKITKPVVLKTAARTRLEIMALNEIRKHRRTTKDLLLPRLPVARLVRDVQMSLTPVKF